MWSSRCRRCRLCHRCDALSFSLALWIQPRTTTTLSRVLRDPSYTPAFSRRYGDGSSHLKLALATKKGLLRYRPGRDDLERERGNKYVAYFITFRSLFRERARKLSSLLDACEFLRGVSSTLDYEEDNGEWKSSEGENVESRRKVNVLALVKFKYSFKQINY